MACFQATANLLTIAGLIAYVISHVTNFWQQTENNHAGIWFRCFPSVNGDRCAPIGWDFNDDNVRLIAIARIVHLIGPLFVIISLLCGIKKSLIATRGVVLILGGIIVAAATAIYLASTLGPNALSNAENFANSVNSLTTNKIGYSMWLSWGSAGAFLISGIILCLVAACCHPDDD